MAAYITLWHGEKSSSRREALPSQATLGPKARVWLKSSEVRVTGALPGMRGLAGQAWVMQTSPKPALFGGEWRPPAAVAEMAPLVVRLTVRGMESSEAQPAAWQAFGRQAQPPRWVQSSNPSFSFGAKQFPRLAASRPQPAPITGAMELWQPGGLSCPPIFARREKRVNPPIRTWIGGLKHSSPRPAFAQDTLSLPTLRALNSYHRRYPSNPLADSSGWLVYPQPARAMR